ncbi:MARVEL domain-containing protein 3 [Strix uralensis]|uniref:MARVEL domain-containing protein 3 n=1 Tax=Strix uralensis TaxID=36305 RepID=UPI003DA60259
MAERSGPRVPRAGPTGAGGRAVRGRGDGGCEGPGRAGGREGLGMETGWGGQVAVRDPGRGSAGRAGRAAVRGSGGWRAGPGLGGAGRGAVRDPGGGRAGARRAGADRAGDREGPGRGSGWGGPGRAGGKGPGGGRAAAVRAPGGSLPSPPPSPLSAAPGAGPGEPPRSRAAAPGLLERHRCRYLRTGRGCCRAVEALLAGLILLCGSVSGGSAGGYTGLPGLGGLYYYQYGGAYSGFSGADGERAQQLDQRFHRLKLPLARAAMAAAGTLMAFSCLLIAAGVLHLPGRFPAWLLLECVLDTVTAIGIVPALYCFFHFLLGVYNSSVCRERERLYQSKGYQGFRCSLHGAEIAAGLLGCVAAIAHLLSAGLAVRGYRAARKLKQKPGQLYEL